MSRVVVDQGEQLDEEEIELLEASAAHAREVGADDLADRLEAAAALAREEVGLDA